MTEVAVPMNLQQAEYFLSVAEYRSFSEAAKSLYMSQPALGRQIRALEIELDLPLFVRGRRALELTAAGKVLDEELGRWINSYNKIVEKARLANASVNATLDIGILEGHRLGSLFPAIYDYFCVNCPDIQVNTHRMSFGLLLENLYNGDVDIAVTLDFDVAGQSDLEYRIIAEVENFLVVPSRHRMANQENLTLKDFKDDVFILN